MVLNLEVYRYDPGTTEERTDRFIVEVGERTTVLDALVQVQAEADPTLAFRYACRVGMCGSCAMVVNGRERWTCRTLLSRLGGDRVSIRPLYHFPLVRDLVVDMAPLTERMTALGAAFVPSDDGEGFARISPAAPERSDIDSSIECIGCGACLSACSLVGSAPGFLGPAPLLRAFTLVRDSRDGARDARLLRLLGEDGIYRCHTHFDCVEVCPMGLAPTAGILALKRLALRPRARSRPPGRTGSTSR